MLKQAIAFCKIWFRWKHNYNKKYFKTKYAHWKELYLKYFPALDSTRNVFKHTLHTVQSLNAPRALRDQTSCRYLHAHFQHDDQWTQFWLEAQSNATIINERQFHQLW